MSLTFSLDRVQATEVFSGNITHNLVRMAKEAYIYNVLWRPEEVGIETAAQVIPVLREGINHMKLRPDVYRAFNPKNGWGTYEDFVGWCEEVLKACEKFPDAKVRVSR